MTGAGAVVVMLVTTILGGLVDLATGPGLGFFAGLGLVLGAGLATLLVRSTALTTTVIAPPLVYLVVIAPSILVLHAVTLSPASVATRLVYGFPSMAIATGVAIVLAGIRRLQHR